MLFVVIHLKFSKLCHDSSYQLSPKKKVKNRIIQREKKKKMDLPYLLLPMLFSRHRTPPNQSGVPFLINDFFDNVRYTIVSERKEVIGADVRCRGIIDRYWQLWFIKAGDRQGGGGWYRTIFGIDVDHVFIIKVVDHVRNAIDIEQLVCEFAIREMRVQVMAMIGYRCRCSKTSHTQHKEEVNGEHGSKRRAYQQCSRRLNRKGLGVSDIFLRFKFVLMPVRMVTRRNFQEPPQQ